MVSIRDYAKMNNVSYEAIRQQVKRYEDELNGHIIKQNRTQFLDDVAVDILDQHRKENPVVIINKDTDSRLKQLEDITNQFKGVDKSFAIQAGREIRVMVVPEQVSDADMVLLARDIAKQVEFELEYPGQIKVNVIRESRVTDYAK